MYEMRMATATQATMLTHVLPQHILPPLVWELFPFWLQTSSYTETTFCNRSVYPITTVTCYLKEEDNELLGAGELALLKLQPIPLKQQ